MNTTISHRSQFLRVLLISGGLLASPLAQAATMVFTNSEAIVLPSTGPALLYPSTNIVSGFPETIGKVTVTLQNANHTWPDDLEILLVGPGGQKVILMSDAGDGDDLVNRNLTFDDAATASIPDEARISGTAYKPTNYDDGAADVFRAPAPGPTYGAALSAYAGLNPNGVWSLYIVDDNTGDTGSIDQGWALTITGDGKSLPTISDIPDQTTTEGVSIVGVPFTIGDVETPATNLVLSATSSNTQLVPNANVLFSGTETNRTLTVRPAPGQFGKATITVTVSDGSSSTSDSFLVTVTPKLAPFTNTAAIALQNDSLSGVKAASLYPSTITLIGQPLTLGKVVVTLNGLTHSFPADLDILLVGPAGQKVILMSDVVQTPVNNVNLTFDDAATSSLPELDAVDSGSFKPTNFDTSDVFVSPAPTGPYSASLSAFTGTNPNGTWSLYVVDDDRRTSSGQIANGWSLTIGAAGNSEPVISSIPDQSTRQDTSTAAIPFIIDDSETPPENLTLSRLSSNQILLPNTNIVFGGSGNSRSVTLTPAGSQSGVATVTVTVSDGTNSVSDVFNLTVIAPSTPFAGTNAITILDKKNADPYPANLTVAGISGTISKVTVTLTNLSHTAPPDLDILLVGPGGAKVVLMSDAGSSDDLTNATLTFDDAALNSLPEFTAITAGVYRPTSFDPAEVFTTPAPSGPYGAALSDFRGINPNGTWSLYVVDDSTDNAGTLSRGWLLNIYQPAFSDIQAQTNSKNTTVTIPFTVGEVGSDPTTLTVTATSSSPTLIPSTNITVSGTAGNRTLTIKPATNQTGTATVTLTAKGTGGSESSKSFQLTVTLGNTAPVLEAIPSRTIHVGQKVTFTARATDSDLPANVLTYSLDPGAPSGATINPATGVFDWKTAEADAGKSFTITVRVADDGVPALNVARTFSITVVPEPAIQSIALSEGKVTLTWSAIDKQPYSLRYKNNLNDAVWLPLNISIEGVGSSATAVDNSIGNAPQRFYQVVVVESP